MKINAKWVTFPGEPSVAAFTFKKEFNPAKKIKKATATASALGIYALYINGARVGKGVLTPGWTSYNSRIQYQTYDVTDLLTSNSTIELGLGQGWAVGYIGHVNTNHCYADKASVIGQIDVVYEDGSKETIATDETWDVYTSAVLSSEIYHGETVDLTAPIEKVGKALPSTVIDPVSRFTAQVSTPSRAPTADSTLAEQAAQLIPETLNLLISHLISFDTVSISSSILSYFSLFISSTTHSRIWLSSKARAKAPSADSTADTWVRISMQ